MLGSSGLQEAPPEPEFDIEVSCTHGSWSANVVGYGVGLDDEWPEAGSFCASAQVALNPINPNPKP